MLGRAIEGEGFCLYVILHSDLISAVRSERALKEYNDCSLPFTLLGTAHCRCVLRLQSSCCSCFCGSFLLLFSSFCLNRMIESRRDSYGTPILCSPDSYVKCYLQRRATTSFSHNQCVSVGGCGWVTFAQHSNSSSGSPLALFDPLIITVFHAAMAITRPQAIGLWAMWL